MKKIIFALALVLCGCGKQQVHQAYQAQGAMQVQGAEMEAFLDPHDSHADSLVLKV